MNYFGLSYNEVRYEISFQNLILLFAGIHKSQLKEDEKEKKPLSSVEALIKAAPAMGLKVKDNRHEPNKGN